MIYLPKQTKTLYNPPAFMYKHNNLNMKKLQISQLSECCSVVEYRGSLGIYILK